MSELPKGWALTTIAELGGLVGGKTPSKATELFWADGTVPWVSPKDMKRSVLVSSEDLISDAAVEKAGMHLLPPASVLMVTRSGILSHTFPVALTAMPCTINQDIKALRPNAALDPRYCAHLLRSLGPTIIGECSKAGTTVASINTESLEQLTLPMAPHAEQQRIADKLDTLLARIDACRDRLDRVGPLLQRFRQSVMLRAFDPEYAEHPGNDGQWFEHEIGAIGQVVTGTTPQRVRRGEPEGLCPLFKPSDLGVGREVAQSDEFVHKSDAERARLLPARSVLVTCIGATIGKTGLAAVPCATNQQINAVVCNPDLVLPEFLYFWCISPTGQRSIVEASSATTLPILNKTKFSSLRVNLPTLDLQRSIVRQVDTLFGFAERAEQRLELVKRSSRRLPASILAKAFRGELVPQDPHDEPASALLARLRQPAAASEPARRRRRAAVP